MKSEPKISIIVPLYNCAIYIPQCVESVINQTYKNWELILVVNNISTDKTDELCSNYAAKDKRIKVVYVEKGLVAARNAGYKASTGDWITYVDGDDWIDTDMCNFLVMSINKTKNIDIIFWKNVQELYGKSIKNKMGWICKDKEHLYVNYECKELARNVLIYKSGIANPVCKLIKADYAKKFDIKHDDRLSQGLEGAEFSLRAFYYAKKALFLNEYFYHYRYNPNSISKRIDENNSVHITNCINVINDDIKSFDDKDLFTKALYERVVYTLIAMAMSTYFHPQNKDKLSIKIKKYKHLIHSVKIYEDSIKYVSTKDMDVLRKTTFYFIKLRMYFMLQLISSIKQFLIQKRIFNY